jgi:hypothetical protein
MTLRPTWDTEAVGSGREAIGSRVLVVELAGAEAERLVETAMNRYRQEHIGGR